mmetsp:Transcript_10640/g.30299  ORF Transcript_10640/g.30299 Transcript_10640/m.30299 type:complete len:200 (+) Transcript_10640:476-1075(+)
MAFGGDIRGSNSSSAFPKRSLAGSMSCVWKAPLVFKIFDCKAPFSSASAFSAFTAFSVPAQEKPSGKSSLAIWQTALGPSFFAACLQRSVSFALGMPATDSISCLPSCAASCIDSPRSLTNLRPSSKEKTPAAQSAVYSPKDRPAQTLNRVAASLLSARNFSRPASPATNITGWQYRVSSSFASGPLRQSSMTSKPRIS